MASIFRLTPHEESRPAAGFCLNPLSLTRHPPVWGNAASTDVPAGASRSSHRSSLPARACRRLGPIEPPNLRTESVNDRLLLKQLRYHLVLAVNRFHRNAINNLLHCAEI